MDSFALELELRRAIDAAQPERRPVDNYSINAATGRYEVEYVIDLVSNPTQTFVVERGVTKNVNQFREPLDACNHFFRELFGFPSFRNIFRENGGRFVAGAGARGYKQAFKKVALLQKINPSHYKVDDDHPVIVDADALVLTESGNTWVVSKAKSPNIPHAQFTKCQEALEFIHWELVGEAGIGAAAEPLDNPQ